MKACKNIEILLNQCNNKTIWSAIAGYIPCDFRYQRLDTLMTLQQHFSFALYKNLGLSRFYCNSKSKFVSDISISSSTKLRRKHELGEKEDTLKGVPVAAGGCTADESVTDI